MMKSFEELGVSEEIRRAISEMGFVQPMPVQEAVIPYLLENRRDVIALAQTGTGKTAAFGFAASRVEELFVAQELIKKVKLKCCGI